MSKVYCTVLVEHATGEDIDTADCGEDHVVVTCVCGWCAES